MAKLPEMYTHLHDHTHHPFLSLLHRSGLLCCSHYKNYQCSAVLGVDSNATCFLLSCKNNNVFAINGSKLTFQPLNSFAWTVDFTVRKAVVDCVGICDKHFVHSTLSASIRLVPLNFYIQSLPLALWHLPVTRPRMLHALIPIYVSNTGFFFSPVSISPSHLFACNCFCCDWSQGVKGQAGAKVSLGSCVICMITLK